jgi:hypothetical protein
MVKNLIESITALIPFLEPYPIRIKSLVSIWLLMTAVMLIGLLFGKPKQSELIGDVESKAQQTTEEVKPTLQEPKPTDKPANTPKQIVQKPLQKVTITDSSGSTVYQASRDIIINSQLPEKRAIQSIMIEGRLICDLKAGAELPPAEVPFLPMGDANAYLEGYAGKVRLDFVSPVRFRRQDDDHIVVINRFLFRTALICRGGQLKA